MGKNKRTALLPTVDDFETIMRKKGFTAQLEMGHYTNGFVHITYIDEILSIGHNIEGRIGKLLKIEDMSDLDLYINYFKRI
jgi:hypothetical protein